MLLWPYLGTLFQTQATFLGFPQLVLTASSSHQNTLRPESFRRKKWNFILKLFVIMDFEWNELLFLVWKKKINFWWTLSQKPHLVHFLKINYWMNCFTMLLLNLFRQKSVGTKVLREIYFCNFGVSINTRYWEAMNFDFWFIFAICKGWNLPHSKPLKLSKVPIFETLNFKLLNFHI